MLRVLVKRTAERLLVAGGAAALARRRLGARTLVLAYHNVVPDGCDSVGDRSLHLPIAAFRRQIELLRAHAEVVPLEALLDPPERSVTGPRVAVTFDDAYRGALRAAIPVLREAGLPCTVFVAPALLGAGTTWWDALAGSGGALPPASREHALWRLGGRAEDVRRWAREAGQAWREVPEWAQPASEAELLEAAAGAGVRIGLHSWKHANLAILGGAEVEADTRRTLDWLAARGIAALPALAFPYGLHSPACAGALAAAGVRAAFRVEGGWSSAGDAPFALPRLNIPSGLSADGFALRLAGLLA